MEGDQYPEYVAQAAEVTGVAEEPLDAQKTPRPLDRRTRFSLQRLLVNPAQYENLQVHVQTTRGNQVTGRFVGLDTEGALVIQRQIKAPGTVSFSLLPSEISDINLLEP